MTILLGGVILVIGFVLGLIADDWARGELDRAVQQARLAAWTDKFEPSPTDDPTAHAEGLGYTIAPPYGLPPNGKIFQKRLYREVTDDGLIAWRFPRLTPQQRATILERRAQERHAHE